MLPIILYVLIVQIFGTTADHDLHPNVRISAGSNGRKQFNHHSQLLRQSTPMRPSSTNTTMSTTGTPTTTSPSTTTGNIFDDDISCSQTFDVSSEDNKSLQFKVHQNNTANLHCVITIYGKRGKQLSLQLTEVDLLPGIFDCEFDSVQVFSLSGGELSFIDKFCNLSHPSQEILTERNVAVLTFNSGNLQNEQGFKIQVQSVLPNTDSNGSSNNGGYPDISGGLHYGYGMGSYNSHFSAYDNNSHTGYSSPMYTTNPDTHIPQTNYGPPTSYPTHRPQTNYGPPTSYQNHIPQTNYGPPTSYPTHTPQTNYGPPTNYPNEDFNISYTNYGVPSNYVTHPPPVYGAPTGTQVNCNDKPWKITDKPGATYGGNLPSKSTFNKEFYTWLTSGPKNLWSKEISNTPQAEYSFDHWK